MQNKANDIRSIHPNAEQRYEGYRYRTSILRLLKSALILTLPALFYFCWIMYYAVKMEDAYMWRGNLAIAVLYGLMQQLLVRTYRGHEVEHFDWQELTISLALSSFINNAFFYLVSFFLCERLVNPLPLLVLELIDVAVCLCWAKCATAVYRKLSPKERLAILYRQESDLERLDHLGSYLRRFSIEKKIRVQEYASSLLPSLQNINSVMIIGVDANVRNGLLKDCVECGIPAYVMPKVGDIILRGASLSPLSGEIILCTNRAALSIEYSLVKRCLDILVSLIGILLTGIVMLITAAAIKLEDGGPVFYRQCRLTKDGQEFDILKFRSMRVDAEKDGVARLSTGENDNRITKVGRVIRKCRIDELPQFFTILGGSMSVVGPRPERPEIAAQYQKVMPAFSLRLQVKAGLTGYAQVYGRYNSTPYEKLQMDLIYINRMSLVEDLRLVFATIRILLEKESTEGISAGSTTAMTEHKDD